MRVMCCVSGVSLSLYLSVCLSACLCECVRMCGGTGGRVRLRECQGAKVRGVCACVRERASCLQLESAIRGIPRDPVPSDMRFAVPFACSTDTPGTCKLASASRDAYYRTAWDSIVPVCPA